MISFLDKAPRYRFNRVFFWTGPSLRAVTPEPTWSPPQTPICSRIFCGLLRHLTFCRRSAPKPILSLPHPASGAPLRTLFRSLTFCGGKGELHRHVLSQALSVPSHLGESAPNNSWRAFSDLSRFECCVWCSAISTTSTGGPPEPRPVQRLCPKNFTRIPKGSLIQWSPWLLIAPDLLCVTASRHG